MKRNIGNISAALLLGMALVSCEKNTETGYLGARVNAADIPFSVESVVTKAAASAGERVFSLEVYNNGGTKVADVADFHDLADNPLELVVDAYRIVACSGDNAGAAFDAPFYAGETVVSLRPEKLVTAEITARLANVAASVSLDRELAGECSEYSVKVSNGAGNALIFDSKAGTFDKTGYFSADGVLGWEITLRKEVPGEDDIVVNKKGVIDGVEANRHYVIEFQKTGSVSGSGFGTFQVIVNDGETRSDYNFTLNFDAADADMVSVDAWAKFAVARAKWFAIDRPEGLTFFYRKASDSESDWTAFDAASIDFNEETKTFTADITGLSPATDYVVKAAASADDDSAREKAFTTGGTPSISNMNFDAWYTDGYDIPANDAASRVWDTANPGTDMLSVYPTHCETADVVSGKAVRMESLYKVKFAAGNIYTGKFQKATVSPMGAKLDWGVPFNGRPVAMRGYYKYKPSKIDYSELSAHPKGTIDEGEIKIILTDWTGMFNISTGDNKFLDESTSNKSIIAKGSIVLKENNDGYVEFVMPIEYRDNTRIPTYAVIVATSSRYGDDFTGGTGSTLYVDEFSLEYDLETLTDAEKLKVNYR